MKTIPLNSLVIIVHPLGSGIPSCIDKFDNHELVSVEQIRYDLVGDYSRFEINKDVYNELKRKVKLKLKLGERVVVDSPNLRKDERQHLADIGNMFDVPVFYLIYDRDLESKLSSNVDSSIVQKHHSIFKKHEWEILRGDNIAEVIDARFHDFEVISKAKPDQKLDELLVSKNLNGVTVVGDIHGSLEGMKSAVQWARQRKHLLVFLGDVIDYGPKSIECMSFLYDLIVRGEAVTILGNHEAKIEHYIRQKDNNQDIYLSEGNLATVRKLNKLTHTQRNKWVHQFNTVLAFSRHYWLLENFLFAHGGCVPQMFEKSMRRLPFKSTESNVAMFGELDKSKPKNEDGSLNKVFDWVDRIPANKTAIVGHTIRDTYQPHVQPGKKGGTAIFLDTGCSKGGSLSSCDIRYANGGYKITNYKKH